MSSDEEYVYESGSDGGDDYVYSEDDGSGAESEIGSDVELENKFWEADGIKREEPTEALKIFNQYLVLEDERVEQGKQRLQHEDVGSVRFRVLFEVVLLCFQLQQFEDMLTQYEKLLQYLQYVTRNERSRAISDIIGVLVSSQNKEGSDIGDTDVEITMKIYEMTLKVLESSNIDERLTFSTKKNLGIMYYERKEYDRARSIVEQLHSMCQIGGVDDSKKAEWLLEMYSLEIQLCNDLDDSDRMKLIFNKTSALSNAIRDPRTMGIIHECGGKMFMKEKKYLEAYNEFFDGFKNYQETADPRAQKCLKYVVLANMLGSSNINPFDSHEAKAFQDYPEIKAIVNIRNAYDSCDARAFELALRDERADLMRDTFLVSFIEPLMLEIRSKVVKDLIKPYKTVSLAFIARHLNVKQHLVEELVYRLIVDGALVGKIDQITGILHLGSNLQDQKNKAVNSWISSLDKMRRNFESHPAWVTVQH